MKDGPPSKKNGAKLYDEVWSLPKVTTNGDFIISGFKENYHNWTKQNVFCELPYWRDQLLYHNLDIMHIEKKFSDNIINTVMNVPGKIKDDVNARLDMVEVIGVSST